MPLKRLNKAEGYSLDARPPRWDPIAVSFANKHFGKDTVTAILRKYKRARVSLEYLTADIEEYDVDYKPRVHDDAVYVSALQSVREEFKSQQLLIPLTMGAASTSASVPKDKSPGLPWIHEGFKTKKDVWNDPDAMKRIRTEWILLGKGYHQKLPDCLVYARAQMCAHDENKVRATWGYPTSVFTEEIRYVYPYLDFLKKRRDDYPLAYGVEMANGGMGYINEMFIRSGDNSKAGMLDWRRFDKNVPPWLIRDAFSILKENFDFAHVRDSEGLFWNVNPEITNNRWNIMVNYFINTPFRLPTGQRFRKAGGVPSGSAWTNIVDSIINAIVTRYCTYHCMGSFPEYDIYMGDDSVIITKKTLNIDDIAIVALEKFGFILNTRKSYITHLAHNIQFLGYYNYDGFPLRDMDFLIASWMLPEHVNDPDPVFTAVRAVGQMYSTFNGEAAQHWFAVIEDIESQYNLSSSWFVDYMNEYPNRLKFLRLHGLEASKFPQPQRFDMYNAPMMPDPYPKVRRPCHRTTVPEDLYCRYHDDPLPTTDSFATIPNEDDSTGDVI